MNIKSIDLLYYGSAICTGIAGILHLILVPNAIDSNINNATLFLIGGIAQIFLGPADDKETGQNMVRSWNCRHDYTDRVMGDY